MPPVGARRAVRLVGPGLLTLLMLVVMIGLGSWQVERLRWKRALLDEIAQGEASPAVPLPPHPRPFAKVRVTGDFREDLSALYGAEVRATADGPQMGAQFIVPLERPGEPALLVDRGWVPLTRREPVAQPGGTVSVEGYVREGEASGWLSARDDPAARRFYTLNPAAIGAALGLPQVEPFVLVVLGEARDGHYPDPARRLPRLPNNHLSYAVTWYGLALILLVIYGIWARRTLRS